MSLKFILITIPSIPIGLFVSYFVNKRISLQQQIQFLDYACPMMIGMVSTAAFDPEPYFRSFIFAVVVLYTGLQSTILRQG